MAFKQQLDKQLEQCRLRKEAEEMERRMESGKVLTDVKTYIQVSSGILLRRPPPTRRGRSPRPWLQLSALAQRALP